MPVDIKNWSFTILMILALTMWAFRTITGWALCPLRKNKTTRKTNENVYWD